MLVEITCFYLISEFQEIHNKIRPYQIDLIRRDYIANDGWETFLSYEDPEQVFFRNS